MLSSDHILSFLLAALLHALTLLLIGAQIGRAVSPEETEPKLDVSSVELALASIDPVTASAEENAAGPQPEAPLQPLEMPEAEAPPPLPAMPDKPAFADALTPPPEPAPAAVSAPTPAAPPVIAPAPQPASSGKPAATVSGAAADKAQIQPANGGGAYGRIDAHPSLDRPIKPSYPIGARRRGEEGTVILDVAVDAGGKAKAVSLVATSGFADLDRAAERAASQARFKPGTRNGQAVESAARITIIFRLRDA